MLPAKHQVASAGVFRILLPTLFLPRCWFTCFPLESTRSSLTNAISAPGNFLFAPSSTGSIDDDFVRPSLPKLGLERSASSPRGGRLHDEKSSLGDDDDRLSLLAGVDGGEDVLLHS
eukprot:TRINITY_DN69039_c0_g1_i1.p2 TRINITY_DN69039_c0_g1~~TRINITY_DN69039_c0_g1_i1.p2  ORF type:complete len:117 (+),score=13.24 TRINITY_DN69039_c0_g1_i1:136-486(+)